MSRKPKKGYFVRGQFVAEGSELDIELKAELKGTTESSRTDLKRESDELQVLGKDLLSLNTSLFQRLGLPDKLVDALAEARRITNFEGKRRQMQFVGKLMRKLDEGQIAAIHAAMEEQRNGSPTVKLHTHQAELWRSRLLADDAELAEWLEAYPETDRQPLRALIRQARKDVASTAAEAAPAEATSATAPRKGRAYRELFQMLREQISGIARDDVTLLEEHGDEDDIDDGND